MLNELDNPSERFPEKSFSIIVHVKKIHIIYQFYVWFFAVFRLSMIEVRKTGLYLLRRLEV